MEPAHTDDAHRRLEKSHSLAASLSHVEIRQVRNDYTFRLEGKLYQIERSAIVSGMRGGNVRVEKRLDGAIAVRYSELYLAVEECIVAVKRRTPLPAKPAEARRTGQRSSDWNKNFDLHKAPKIWQVAAK